MKAKAQELMPFHPNIQSTRREFKLSSHTPAACFVTAEGSASIPFSLLMFFPSFPLFSVFHEPRVINTVSEFPMNSWTKIHGISSKDYQILSFPFNFCFYTRMVQAKHF